MNTIIYWIAGIILALGISLLFESIREFILDCISGAWEILQDGFVYLISFEWIFDLWEGFTGLFENLDEFSVWGICGGVFCVAFIWVTSDIMLNSFTQYMPPFQRTYMTIIIYVMSFVLGYLIGKKMLDD